MIKDLPVIVILIPLLGALLTLIAGRINRIFSWYLAAVSTFFSFIGVFVLVQAVWHTGRISYWLGGWEPPRGIEYVVDYLNGFVLVVISFVTFAVTIYAKKSVEQEIPPQKQPVFYTTYLLFVTGLLGVVITGDIFNLYVFLEILSLTSYGLIAMGKKREALIGSYNYLIMGSVGATFILLGIGHLYMMTGTLNMADLREILPAVSQSRVVLTAFAFFVIGLSIKIALFPLHNWLPNAYTYAPSAVSAIMAATSTKAGAYILIRVIFTVFGPAFMLSGMQMNHLFVFFAAVAILAGSIMAVAQTDIKKMLAYSSIGQIGYIVLGVGLMNLTGIMGSLLHVLNHALMKGCLFLVVGAVVYRLGITKIADFKGLGKKMPVSMAAFTVAAVSMIGVPLTVGFVSKWYLAVASLEAGMGFLIFVLMLSSLLIAVYFWRVIDNIYFQPCADVEAGHRPNSVPDPSKPKEAPVLMLVPTVVLAALCIVFGIFSALPLSIAEKAATVLLK
jgi:multicomponent Na+:H+ antiporter subunit D